MFFLISIGTPGCGGLIAAALRMVPRWNVPAAARPPATRPERCRKVRRSIGVGPIAEVEPCILVRAAWPSLRLVSLAHSLLQRFVPGTPVRSEERRVG